MWCRVGGGSSLPGLREVTAEEFLQVNKGLMLAFHRDFVCGVPYGPNISSEYSSSLGAFTNYLEGFAYSFVCDYGLEVGVEEDSGNSYARLFANGGLSMDGNFYDVKLFEVVE